MYKELSFLEFWDIEKTFHILKVLYNSQLTLEEKEEYEQEFIQKHIFKNNQKRNDFRRHEKHYEMYIEAIRNNISLLNSHIYTDFVY